MPTHPAEWTPFGATLNRPVVLFIEDNVTQLDLYAMVVEEQFAVLRATRAEQGFELASTKQPAAIVVDVLLPDADGLALCDRFRADPRTASIPLLVLTGDDDAFARAQALRFRFRDVLAKPCSATRLLAVLRSATTPAR